MENIAFRCFVDVDGYSETQQSIVVEIKELGFTRPFVISGFQVNSEVRLLCRMFSNFPFNPTYALNNRNKYANCASLYLNWAYLLSGFV